jgi:hypothetical protein
MLYNCISATMRQAVYNHQFIQTTISDPISDQILMHLFFLWAVAIHLASYLAICLSVREYMKRIETAKQRQLRTNDSMQAPFYTQLRPQSQDFESSANKVTEQTPMRFNLNGFI